MGFFDDIPSQPGTRRAWPRPDGQLKMPLATRLLLARTDQAAVAVVGLWAFTEGFEFQVTVQLRAAVPGTSAASFLSALDGAPLEDEFLRLGIQFSTGEKAANTELRATRDTGGEPVGPTMKNRVAGPARCPATGHTGSRRCRRQGRWRSSAPGPRSVSRSREPSWTQR